MWMLQCIVKVEIVKVKVVIINNGSIDLVCRCGCCSVHITQQGCVKVKCARVDVTDGCSDHNISFVGEEQIPKESEGVCVLLDCYLLCLCSQIDRR